MVSKTSGASTPQPTTAQVPPVTQTEIRAAINDDFGDLLSEWSVDNVPNGATVHMREVSGLVAEKKEVDEIKDGKKTGAKITKAFVNIEYKGDIKQGRLGKSSLKAIFAVYGTQAKNWKDKQLIAVHDQFGTNKFIKWIPKPAE